MIRWLAALLVALVTTVTAAAAAAESAGHSILWSVRGEHNSVYLFGSIHVLRSGDVGLPPAAAKAYGDAERIVMEIDMDDPPSFLESGTDDIANCIRWGAQWDCHRGFSFRTQPRRSRSSTTT